MDSAAIQLIIMSRLCIYMGMIVFGWIGWWIGSKFGGFMTSLIVSSIAGIIGVYIGWRINNDYLS